MDSVECKRLGVDRGSWLREWMWIVAEEDRMTAAVEGEGLPVAETPSCCRSTTAGNCGSAGETTAPLTARVAESVWLLVLLLLVLANQGPAPMRPKIGLGLSYGRDAT